MRIAIVNPYPVFSRAVGGVTRVYGLVRHLAPRHRVAVFAHASGDLDADAEAVREINGLGAEQHLFPRPPRGPSAQISWLAASVPYHVCWNRNPHLEAALNTMSQEADSPFDVVHTEFAYMQPALTNLDARTIRVLAEQETMSLAVDRLRELPLRQLAPFEYVLRMQRRKILRFERAVLPTFDRCYGITEAEASRMAEATRTVHILPHVVCTRAFTVTPTEPANSAVLFVGNYAHTPNLHALAWFTERVWPLVRTAAPHAVFDVVGPGMSPAARARFERIQGVRIRGRVEDLRAAYHAAAVFVNPIRSGGGMRGKVLEAFACGRAVVSTDLGMDGIAAQAGVHFTAANDPRSFALAIGRYLASLPTRRQHGAAARELVERLYDRDVVFGRLECDYEELAGRRHHRMAS